MEAPGPGSWNEDSLPEWVHRADVITLQADAWREGFRKGFFKGEEQQGDRLEAKGYTKSAKPFKGKKEKSEGKGQGEHSKGEPGDKGKDKGLRSGYGVEKSVWIHDYKVMV